MRVRGRGQKIFLGISGLFLAFLIGSVALRSNERRSLTFAGEENSAAAGGSVQAQGGSGIRLQEFKRTQIKDGKKLWSVVASEASYYAAEDVAHVNAPQVVFYRPGGSEVHLTSATGKLYLKGEDLQRAELEGDVLINFDASLTVKSTAITYDSSGEIVSSSQPVNIVGPGYEVNGVGMRLVVDNQIVDLLSQVDSSFTNAAAFPQSAVEALEGKGSGKRKGTKK